MRMALVVNLSAEERMDLSLATYQPGPQPELPSLAKTDIEKLNNNIEKIKLRIWPPCHYYIIQQNDVKRKRVTLTKKHILFRKKIKIHGQISFKVP